MKVCVGSSCKRFVVRATHLNHPIFKKLLVQAEEEYGFNNQGPLAIPCNESLFEEVLQFISQEWQQPDPGKNGNNPTRFMNLEDFQRYCHMGIRKNLDFWPESRLLLHGIVDKGKHFVSDLGVTQSKFVHLHEKKKEVAN